MGVSASLGVACTVPAGVAVGGGDVSGALAEARGVR